MLKRPMSHASVAPFILALLVSAAPPALAQWIPDYITGVATWPAASNDVFSVIQSQTLSRIDTSGVMLSSVGFGGVPGQFGGYEGPT